jgi:hypothetical protein
MIDAKTATDKQQNEKPNTRYSQNCIDEKLVCESKILIKILPMI